MDNIFLIFNSISGALAAIDKGQMDIINNIKNIDYSLLSDIEKEFYNNCIRANFIIDNEKDEIADFKIKRYYQKFNSKSLYLTIAPTLLCNFKCIYCFENGNSSIINSQICDNIINFVKKYINEGVKKLNISWYGGEPMICKNDIYYLSKKLIKLAKDSNCEYNALMVSNGSLIEEEDISLFSEYKIKKIQITIDGTEKIHNLRRVAKNGVNYYEKIINNINSMIKKNINVIIRINVDKNNFSEIEQLLKYLNKNLVTKNIKINFGKVVSHTVACKSVETDCYSNKEFSDVIFELQALLEKYEFNHLNPLMYPKTKFNYCSAEILNSYVIDPVGNLYKCWNEIGEKTSIIGNVKNFNQLTFLQSKWIFNDLNDKCQKCSVMPICVGGCPHNKITNNDSYTCEIFKYNLDKILKEYYKKQQKK